MKPIITHKKKRNNERTVDDLCVYLGLNRLQLVELVKDIPVSYLPVLFPKKDGTKRTLFVPSGSLKKVQKKIHTHLLCEYEIPLCVYGYGKGKTIIDNAKLHRNGDYLLNLDLNNFFPSIHFLRVQQVFRDLGWDRAAADILMKLSTFKYQLPQGAPTSPLISCIVLSNLDYRLYKLSKSAGVKYSRYFDDLSFSSGNDLVRFEKTVLSVIKEEGYKVKSEKRKLCNKGEPKEITGISIVKGKLSPVKFEPIRKQISRILSQGFTEEELFSQRKTYHSLKCKILYVKKVNQKRGDYLFRAFSKITWEWTSFGRMK